MKRLLSIVTVLAGLSVPAIALADDIEEFARAFMAAEELAWEQGDFDALEALEHPDVKFQNINGVVIEGWEAHMQAIIDAVATYDDGEVQQEWTYLMGDGDIFAVSYVWTASIGGQPTRIEGIAVGRVDDDRLVEEWGAGYSTPILAQ